MKSILKKEVFFTNQFSVNSWNNPGPPAKIEKSEKLDSPDTLTELDVIVPSIGDTLLFSSDSSKSIIILILDIIFVLQVKQLLDAFSEQVLHNVWPHGFMHIETLSS